MKQKYIHLEWVALRHEGLYFSNKQIFEKLMTHLGWGKTDIDQMKKFLDNRRGNK